MSDPRRERERRKTDLVEDGSVVEGDGESVSDGHLGGVEVLGGEDGVLNAEDLKGKV